MVYISISQQYDTARKIVANNNERIIIKLKVKGIKLLSNEHGDS